MTQATQAQQMATQAQLESQRQQQQQQTERKALGAKYEDLARSPGYSPEEKGAITTATLSGVGGAYEGLRNAASLRSTRTRNEAGYNELLGQAARQQAGTVGRLSAENEAGFANRAAQDREFALQSLSQLYGVDAQQLARALGLPIEYLQAGNQALGVAGSQRSGFSIGLGPLGSYGYQG